jgi:hypothetical protein
MNTNQRLFQISPFNTHFKKKNKSHLKSFSNDSSKDDISNKKSKYKVNSLSLSKQSSLFKNEKLNYSYRFILESSTKNETLKPSSINQDQSSSKNLFEFKQLNKNSIMEEFDQAYEINKKNSIESNVLIPIKSTLKSLNLEYRKKMKKFLHEETSRSEKKENICYTERLDQSERIDIGDHSLAKDITNEVSPYLSPVLKLKFKEIEPVSPLFKTPVKKNKNESYLPKLHVQDSNSLSYGNVFNSTYTQLPNNNNSKVDSIYKTELRLRESINKGIISKNSTILSDKKSCQKISNLNTLYNYETIKNPKLLVKELYYDISDRKKFAQISKLLINPQQDQYTESLGCATTKATESPRNKKFKLPIPKFSKPNFFEINSNISFPSILLDKHIICSVYNDNLLNLKKYFNTKKSNELGQSDKQPNINFHGSTISKYSTRK